MYRVLFLAGAVILTVGAQPVRAQSPIGHLSVDDKLAQLLFVGFEGTAVTPDLKHLVADWHVGGVVLYAQNIESSAQTSLLNQEIRNLAQGGVAPFIAIDQEGGSVQRLQTGVAQLPGAMALGATRSPALAQDAGESLGGSLRALGFTMNFAPVLDVLSNPSNTALGTRAFSGDPDLVASLGSAFIRGELDAGIIPVGKHFPGQGGTAGDSHYSLPILSITRDQLEKRELVPFRAAIVAGVPAVMTAHIALPLIAETADTPATLSHRLLTDILRRSLHFDGIVITDELQMRAIQGHRQIGDVAVDALLAGSDMIMVVWDHRDREEIYAALKAAYASGRLPDAVVERALRHIFAAKASSAHRSLRPPPSPAQQIALVERIAEQAVTQTRRALPEIKPDDGVVFIGVDGPLRSRFATTPWIPTPPRVDDRVLQHALERTSGTRVIVAAIASGNDRLLLLRLRQKLPSTRLIIICMGSPQLLAGIDNPETVIYTYSDLPAFQEAAAKVLFDGKIARGTLPVPSPFPVVARPR
jgi:beta-N-acetylhexosaminidase